MARCSLIDVCPSFVRPGKLLLICRRVLRTASTPPPPPSKEDFKKIEGKMFETTKTRQTRPSQTKANKNSSWSNWAAKCAEIPSKRRFTDKTFAYFDWTRPVVCAQWASKQWRRFWDAPVSERNGTERVGSLWHAANKLRRALGSDSSNTQQQQQQHNGGNYDCDKGIGIWQSGIGERA